MNAFAVRCFFVCAFVRVHLVVGLLGGAGGELVDVLSRRRQVSRQVPHLYGEVLAARHHERRFHPGQRHAQRVIDCVPVYFASKCGSVTWSR